MSINSTEYEMALDRLQHALEKLTPKGKLIVGSGMSVLITDKNLYGNAAIAKKLDEAVERHYEEGGV